MSRKLESIDIEVNERKGTPMPTWEVIIPGKRSIGIIEQDLLKLTIAFTLRH